MGWLNLPAQDRLKNIRETLEQNGFSIFKLGDTFVAIHAHQNGNMAQSAIDHIYRQSPVKSPDIKTT